MAKDDKAKAPPAGGARKDEAAAAPKKKSKAMLFVVIGVVAVLLLGGGGAAWWFLRGHPAEHEAAGKEAAPAAKAPDKSKPAVFVALETFTVNLQQESGERYLQTTLSLRVADATVEQAIKQLMPEIRSKLVLLLSSKKASELSSIEGKQALANQIATEVNAVLNPGAAKASPAAAKPAPEPAPADKGAAHGEHAAAPGDKAAAPGEKPAEAAPPSAAPKPPAPAAEPQGPVLSVLFTNFIIQ